MKSLLSVLCCLMTITSTAQKQFSISGTLRNGSDPAAHAVIRITSQSLQDTLQRTTDDNGFFRVTGLSSGAYQLLASIPGLQEQSLNIELGDKNITVDINMQRPATAVMKDVVINAKNELVSGRLNDISGTAIYAGKKTEVILLKNINANLATNNTRQIYARIPGLNIWEYDRGGLQLGIGGRGLSPNRSSNFNIRQDGYDISADALGYPESYYTPSAEALERIEIIRGAASLQYGPQFGGLINFVMKEGPKDKAFELTTRQTAGSYGFFNSFNSIGGTVAKGKLNYYTFYQFKRGDDWRPNSHYDQHNAAIRLAYTVNSRLKISGEYVFMQYLAQQPGGLTDAWFNEDASQSFRARNWFKVNWNLINLNLDYRFNDHTKLNFRNFTLQGSRDALGVLSYINRPDMGGNRDLMVDKYNNFGSELRLIHQYRLFKEQRSTFLIGGRLYRGQTDRAQGNASDGSDADFSFIGKEADKSDNRYTGDNIAAFAENIFQITKNWTVTPGLRFEYLNTKGSGYHYDKNVFIADDKVFESSTKPRSFMLLGIGTSRKFQNGMELYANISQNYRSININDLRIVNPNSRIDSNLKDEFGYNIDLGFRGSYKGWLYMDVSLFYLKYNGRIGSIFVRDSDFMTYRLRTNISDSRNYGLEFLLEGDILKALTDGKSKYKLNIYTNLSLIDARYVDTDNPAIANKLVENVPPLLFRTGLSFGTPRFNITYQFSHQAKQYSDATNTEITPTAVDGAIPAFSVMDLSLSYNWRQFTVYSGINNLTNKKYFTRRADGYPGPGILPADRRNIYLTFQFKM